MRILSNMERGCNLIVLERGLTNFDRKQMMQETRTPTRETIHLQIELDAHLFRLVEAECNRRQTTVQAMIAGLLAAETNAELETGEIEETVVYLDDGR